MEDQNNIISKRLGQKKHFILYPFVNHEDRAYKVEIERKYHITTNRNRIIINEVVIVLLLVLAWSIIAWGSVKLFALDPVPWSNAFAVALSLGSVIIVYRQWQLARYEISIDKYYDRLDSANRRLDALDNASTRPITFHIFAEIDKLEYALVKYKYGFISPTLAYRALQNFESLCRDKDKRGFNQGALAWVKEAAYIEETRFVVQQICEKYPIVTDTKSDSSVVTTEVKPS